MNCGDEIIHLWIAGAEKGAYAYDFLTRKLKLYRHNKDHINCLSSNGINSIYEDAAHRLWFCTSESGIDLFEEGKGFTNFNEADNELLSNCVYGACSDKSNKLYIITDKGLSILNVATRQITNYAVGKSLPLTAVNQNAICYIIREMLDFKPQSRMTDIGGAMEFISGVMRRRCTAFVLSDFYERNDFTQPLTIANRKHDVVAIQVYDHWDRQMPDLGIVRMVDAETGVEQYVDTSSRKLRDAHHRYWMKRQMKLNETLQKCNVDSISVATGPISFKKHRRERFFPTSCRKVLLNRYICSLLWKTST